MYETEMTFSRVFDTVRDQYRGMKFTTFGFEAEGQRHRVCIDGWPRVESGQRVTALLPSPGKWANPLGWVCHDTGEIVKPQSISPGVFRATSAVAYVLILFASVPLLLLKGAFPGFSLCLLAFILGVGALQVSFAKSRSAHLANDHRVNAQLQEIAQSVQAAHGEGLHR